MRSATKIVEDQVKKWARNRYTGHSERSENKIKPIITISREFGAEGAALAKLLREKLEFELWDQELLQLVAEESGSDEKFLQSVDERWQQMIKDAMMGMLKMASTNVRYLRSIIKVIKTIEVHGNGIVVGRGANYICTLPDALHVRVVCAKETRIKRYAEKNGIDYEESKLIVEMKDRERAEFVLNHFKKDVNESDAYDIVLNSGSYSQEKMAAIVVTAYNNKTGLDLNI